MQDIANGLLSECYRSTYSLCFNIKQCLMLRVSTVSLYFKYINAYGTKQSERHHRKRRMVKEAELVRLDACILW